MAKQVPLGAAMQGFLMVMNGSGKSFQESSRRICREGCVVSGRMVRSSVRRKVPVFKPGAGLFQPYGATFTRQKYGIAPGELRDSIYFTNSKRRFNWKAGKLRYIVGFPHASKGKVTPGWYAHFVEFGHRRVNAIAMNDRTGYQWPLKARGSRRLRVAIQHVPGHSFMGAGIAAVSGSINGVFVNAMRKQLVIECAKMTI